MESLRHQADRRRPYNLPPMIEPTKSRSSLNWPTLATGVFIGIAIGLAANAVVAGWSL